MKMHALSHLSISSILSLTRMIWIALFAFILIGEQLQPLEYVGIIVLFLGISITVSPHKFFIDKGAQYANLAAIVIALNTVLIKMTLPYMSATALLAISSLLATVFLLFFMKNPKKQIVHSIKNRPVLKFLAVALSVFSFYLFVMALKTGDAGKVNGIYQGMIFTQVLVGIIFLKEREDIGRKLLGAVVTIVGILLLA